MNPRIAGAALASLLLASPSLAQSLPWLRSPVNLRWYAAAPRATSRTEAMDWARANGAELATVRSAQEQAWLESQFFAQTSPWSFHWLGLFQDPLDPNFAEPGGGWKWLSGEPTTYFNWAAGAPDNAAPGESFARTRGALDPSAPGAWEDADDVANAAPSGLLDWHIGAGQIVLFNTANSTITLGQMSIHIGNPSFPNDPQSSLTALFAPTEQRTILGGVVEVRHFFLHHGAVLKIEGPNAFHLLASGDVWIRGKVHVDGGHALESPISGTFRGPLDGTWTSNPNTSYLSPGGPGQAGGGDGGSTYYGFMAPPAAGEAGEGAFGVAGRGGQGGETGWSPINAVDDRRGAGGGGGRLGPDPFHPAPPSSGPLDQRRIGLDAERGFDNLQGANGALGGAGPPQGGAIAASPFETPDARDDFFGVARELYGDVFVVGELETPWAGAGGGAGGASFVFGGSWPPPAGVVNYVGGGGGGGAGSFRVTALGVVYFGSEGFVRARGGMGAGGTNSIFLNRLGGGGGGGSGGHVILESAKAIDLRASPLVVLEAPLDNRFAIDARGGQGGPGKANLGGAQITSSGYVETQPALDACPAGYPTTGANACRGHVNGAGGDGGPGLVQLHTPRGSVGSTPGSNDILLPSGGATLERICAPRPLFTESAGPLRLVSGAGGGQGVFELESDDCDSDGEPDLATIATDPASDANSNGVLDACEASFTFCGPGSSANACEPRLVASGVASASATGGFTLALNSADGARLATIFYGLDKTATPFAAGALCVRAPLRRVESGLTTGSAGACNGSLDVDWNAWRAANPQALGAPFAAGDVLYAQAWLREGAAVSGSNWSDALKFTLAP
jgi:hypothetical protein